MLLLPLTLLEELEVLAAEVLIIEGVVIPAHVFFVCYFLGFLFV